MSDDGPNAFEAASEGPLAAPAPAPGWPAPLTALWWVSPPRAGDPAAWARAHVLVQDAPGPDAAWVHAHLHRVEGDEANAGYWYALAGRQPEAGPLAAERAAIAAALMERL